MKNLFFILFVSYSCYSQEPRNNYIISNNYASEAEFWFHEQQYDSAVYYYEKAFEFASEPHPSQRYNLAKALWKVKKYQPSLEMLKQCRIVKIDTAWFSGLSSARYAEITTEIERQNTRNDSIKNCSIYNAFIDSVKTIDQFYIKQFNSRMDSLRSEITTEIERQNTRNDSIKNCSIYNAFIDSVKTIDQFYIKQFNSRMDSL